MALEDIPVLRDDPEIERVKAVLEARLLGRTPTSSRIGRFVVIERIGAGGMGVVFSAFDPELDRKVAIKLLLDGDGDESERARLLGEAKAMAKLSHPNVVGVYDVGEHGGRVFVAMEYIHGRTLDRWLRETPRSWRETLAICVQAGRGLAAAHSAGIVHRDFKPDNVLIGDDERARVLDFGLARATTDLASESMPLDAADTATGATLTKLTRTGAVLGTPAYMSPEQIRGEAVDAHADQFAFCVTMWEAFAGERPFAGDTVKRLFEHVTHGEVRGPTRAAIPTWIEAVLRRGLSPQRERRYPSMDALLAALERGATRRRRVWIGAGCSFLALAGLGVWGAIEGSRRYEQAQAIAGCEAAGASIAETWNDEVRTQVHDALVASGVSYAETTATRVMPWIDAQAAAWQHARTEACLDVDVRAVWSDDMLDRSLWCLDERRMELEALVDELSRADVTVVQKAVTGAAGLTSVDACRDAALLERLPTPPADRREEVRAVRAELLRSDALGRAGKSTEGLDVVRQARGRADALAWPPLSAAARSVEARMLEREGAYAEAEAVGAQAYFEAAPAGAWDVAADAASLLLFVVGDHLARKAEGLAWGGHAHVALTYAGDPQDLREASRLSRVGLVYERAGEYDKALASQERALAMFEKVLGPDHIHVAEALNNLMTAHFAAGEYAQAERLNERVLAILEKTLGPDHPQIATSLNNLGILRYETRNYEEARRLHERALAIREGAFGLDHRDVAQSLANLANVYSAIGERAQARTLHLRALAIREQVFGPAHPLVAQSLESLAVLHFAADEFAEARKLQERALAITEKALGPDHPNVGWVLMNLANVDYTTGDYAQAQRLYERALAIEEKALGPDHPDVAMSLANLALVHLSKRNYADARKLFERALAISEKSFGPDHPTVAQSLLGLAEVNAASGDDDGAVRLLDRAVDIFDQREGTEPRELEAHFELAKALVATGGDRDRAHRLAELARDGLRAAGKGDSKEFAKVEEWLANER